MIDGRRRISLFSVYLNTQSVPLVDPVPVVKPLDEECLIEHIDFVLIWVPVQGTPYYVLTGYRNCPFIYSREAKGHAARKAVAVAVLAAVTSCSIMLHHVTSAGGRVHGVLETSSCFYSQQ